MKVEELIDTFTQVWRTNLLSELFCLEEVSLVLSLPINFRAPVDRLVWHYDEWGLYSVNSSASSFFNGSAYERLWKHLEGMP